MISTVWVGIPLMARVCRERASSLLCVKIPGPGGLNSVLCAAIRGAGVRV